MHIWSIDYVLGPYSIFAYTSVQQKKEQEDFVIKSLQAVVFPFSSHLLQPNIECGGLSLELLVRTGLAVEGFHV